MPRDIACAVFRFWQGPPAAARKLVGSLCSTFGKADKESNKDTLRDDRFPSPSSASPRSSEKAGRAPSETGSL